MTEAEIETHANECDCAECREMCWRPCWPTPAEARRLMALGHADRLMLDCWNSDWNLPYTEILCPAVRGYGGAHAPIARSALFGGCVFWASGGACELHGVCKPLEGRAASHDTPEELHLDMAKLWDTDDGRAVVAEWRAR